MDKTRNTPTDNFYSMLFNKSETGDISEALQIKDK